MEPASLIRAEAPETNGSGFLFALFDAIDRFEATSFRRDCFAPSLQPSMIADVRGRVIDVSLSAARALGMMRDPAWCTFQCNDCPNENPGMKAGARDAPLGTSASNDQTRSITGPGRV